jgi:hypothetical protein
MTPFTPSIEPALEQLDAYWRLAWFLYGWLEREQLLNLDACGAGWLRGFLPVAGQPSAASAPVVAAADR